MAFFKATIVLLALCFLDGSLAGRSRSLSPPRTCQKCPTLKHPSHPQCSIETSCDNGQCGITLDRCGAEFINAHYGQQIDLKLFDEGPNNGSEPELVSKEIYYNPDTKVHEPVTADHVRNSKYHYQTVYEQVATTNSEAESEIEEDELASTNSPPGGGYIRNMHVHRLGCTRCGKPWPCWYNSDCAPLIQGAYCYQADRRYPGICKWNYSVLTNSGTKLVSVCCEQ